MTTTWIRQVPVPILMVRDEADALVMAQKTQWLLGNATAPGSRFLLRSWLHCQAANCCGRTFDDREQTGIHQHCVSMAPRPEVETKR